MTNLTLMRLYLKMKSMPRLPLPTVGYAGILYSSALIERNRYAYQKDVRGTTGSPELGASKNLLIPKGAMGCWRHYSTSTSVEDVKKAEMERLQKKKFKPMTAETIKILLVSETGSLSTMTLLDAQSLAKKKRMELVHIVDDKEKPVGTHKDVYKLASKLTSFDSNEDGESVKENKPKEKKEDKTILLKSNIGEHDLNSKVNMILKFLKKGHRTRILIGQAGDKGNAETVFKMIESRMIDVEGQIQQKVAKGNEIRFYVAPSKVKPPPKRKPVKPQDNDEDEQPDDEYSDSDDESDNRSKKKWAKK